MTNKYESIKNALEVSKHCYDAIRDNIKIGISEKSLYEIVKETIKQYGGDHCLEFVGDFVGGSRTGDIGGDPSDYKLKLGDLFILDLSIKYDDYWCDTCRTFFLGEPTLEQRKAYQIVLNAQDIGKYVVRTGVNAKNVKKVVEEYMISQGYEGLMPHHAGHSVGEAPYQKPAFELECDMTIKDGDVVTLEPGLYFKDKWGMRVENNYIVHDDCLENIFDYTRNIDDFIIKEDKY